MERYKLGSYRRLENVISNDEIEHIKNLILNERHILFVVYYREDDEKIRSVSGYMNSSESKSWYGVYVNERSFLDEYMCRSYMVPSYNYEKRTIEPYDLNNYVVPFEQAFENLKQILLDLGTNDTKTKIYLSEAPGDTENFGGPLECFFCEWLVGLEGWNK